MIDIISILLSDWYKQVHRDQYNSNITKIVDYGTPRGSRISNKKIAQVGMQPFLREILIQDFYRQFFDKSEEYIKNEYERYFNNCLSKNKCDVEPILRLHRLGYLPLKIRAIPEGSLVNIKVPLFEISNTIPEFFWLPNAIESVLSCYYWHIAISATVGHSYREIANKYFKIAVDNSISPVKYMSDFSMRGQHGPESSMRSSGAFCMSFLGTATIPTIKWLETMYDADCTKEPVAFGAISTEHSVMCSNTAIDGHEINSKGFKVLPPYIGLIYGDSITLQRAENIYKRLIDKNIAPNNVVFGVGSFSFMAIEDKDIIQPITRDTFNFAIKATYCEINGKSVEIFKDPKTDNANFKKSQKGCCVVYKKINGDYFSVDQRRWDEVEMDKANELITVFEDGKLYNQSTLKQVRDRLNNGNF